MTLIEGNPQGAVRAVIFEDLQCGDCARLRRMLDSELLPRFAAAVAFEHRDFPLPKHDWARLAAVAARYFDACGDGSAAATGLGMAFRRRTLEQMKQILAPMFPEHIRAFAVEHGVTPPAAAGLAAFEAEVEADYRDGLARGVAKTPTVFVGETAFVEVFTAEELAAAFAGQGART